jgi:hypothetical protein
MISQSLLSEVETAMAVAKRISEEKYIELGSGELLQNDEGRETGPTSRNLGRYLDFELMTWTKKDSMV